MEKEFIMIMVAALGVTFIIMQLIAHRTTARSLKAEAKALEKDRAKLVRENISLEQKLSKKTNTEEELLWEYPFDKTLGIRKHRTSGIPFCNKCMIEKGQKSPLKIENDGWYCPICQVFIKDPDTKYNMGF